MTDPYLAPSQYLTDLAPVTRELDKAGIKYELREHPAARGTEILGYSPVGTHQVVVHCGDSVFSIIRGYVSFGYYEIMKTEGDEGWATDPERFSNARELVKAIQQDDTNHQ